ncbi:MAG: phosphatase PAP2 family protein, partial [Prevotella sp.]|nr:phosphatase PAP2 family protein [Prevotella sp.]
LSLRLAGVESNIPLKEALLGKCITSLTVGGTAYILKHSIHEWRPDHSDRRSFPSGHAAIVFAGATSLHKEYGKRNAWISVGGYALATFVAIDRVAKDRHHWYDVTAGAAIGVAGTEVSYYLAHHLMPSKKLSASLTPQHVYLCLYF